jgi:hypothetical protein
MTPPEGSRAEIAYRIEKRKGHWLFHVHVRLSVATPGGNARNGAISFQTSLGKDHWAKKQQLRAVLRAPAEAGECCSSRKRGSG